MSETVAAATSVIGGAQSPIKVLNSTFSTHLPIEHAALHLINNARFKNIITLFDILIQCVILYYILQIEANSSYIGRSPIRDNACKCSKHGDNEELRQLQVFIKYAATLSISYLIVDTVIDFNPTMKAAAAILSAVYVVVLAYYAWRQSHCDCSYGLYTSIWAYAYISLFFMITSFGVFRRSA